jgi:hypothetical protein
LARIQEEQKKAPLKPAKHLTGATTHEGVMSNEALRPTSMTRIPVKIHRHVCLVQTEDAVLAEELLARKKVAQDVVGRLTDRVLLVRAGRVESVVQELHKMGHTPQVLDKG